MKEKLNKLETPTSGYIEFYPYKENNCVHMLPCGICEITNKYCPLRNMSPTWTTITCNSTGGKK